MFACRVMLLPNDAEIGSEKHDLCPLVVLLPKLLACLFTLS